MDVTLTEFDRSRLLELIGSGFSVLAPKKEPLSDARKQRNKELARIRREKLRAENLAAAKTVLRHRVEKAKKVAEYNDTDWIDEFLSETCRGDLKRFGILSAFDKPKRRYYMQRFATPAWADKEKIKQIYQLRDEMNAECPEARYEVDHIIPILSDVVCGLHVHENLQILTKDMNMKKGRKFEID